MNKKRCLDTDNKEVIKALLDLAHATWHLMDESGEEYDSPDFVHCGSDHKRVDMALTRLEDMGWKAHDDD